MVNKFGDKTDGTTSIINLQTVKRVTATSGKYKDYIKQIQESYNLGFTPYRLHVKYSGNWVSPVRCYDKKVYVSDNEGAMEITEGVITTDVLIYWTKAEDDEDDAASAIIGDQGPAGPVGKKGKRGATGPPGEAGPPGKKGDKGDSGGKQGDPGAKGDKGERGAVGAKGKKGDKGDQGIAGAEGKKGDRGPKGDKGDQGIAGVGKRGVQGPVGPAGSIGATGPRGETGIQGAQGDKGENAMDICSWFPSQTLAWLRLNEDCSYYFETNTDFLTDGAGNITGFKSHSSKGKNAISLKRPIKKIQLHPRSKGYCAEFSGGSLFKIAGVDLAMNRPSYTFIAITFKMDTEPASEQFILCDELLNRGLSIDAKTINIYGTSDNPLKLTYKHKKWITIGIQWTLSKTNHRGYFYLNDKDAEGFRHGTFVTTQSAEEINDVYIGGLSTGKGGNWQACLAALDIHDIKEVTTEMEYPEGLRKLILNDHRRRVSGI